MREVRVLAFDLGASSGRAMLGRLQGDTLRLDPVHRFANGGVVAEGRLRWDFPALLEQVRRGVALGGEVDAVGFDTWGVDYGLLDRAGALIEWPIHYRDRRDGFMDAALERVSPEELYARTGNQILPINTLFQLCAQQARSPGSLKRAERLLFLPALLAHAVCGSAENEACIASTSQCRNPITGEWDTELLKTLGIPTHFLRPVTAGGSVVGTLRTGGRSAQVLAIPGHDTQCAVAALPACEPNAAFLSSGTWSLLGCKTPRPVLSPAAMALGISNEAGADGQTDCLKNIVGLWLVQECRRVWAEQGHPYSFGELARLAEEAPPFRAFLDPDAPCFSAPCDMPARIAEACRRTGQPIPQTPGETVRCIYESLALKVSVALEELQQATGKRFEVLHVVGGGAKVDLLNRMLANACGVRVTAGPSEATALGNVLAQLTALGCPPPGTIVGEGCEPPQTYRPEEGDGWGEAKQRYRAFLRKRIE